jgi:tetratricopeptide (TPR) repeat protein
MNRKARRVQNAIAKPAAPAPAATPPQSLIDQLKQRGLQYLQANDFAGARFTFQKVLELDPKDIWGRMVYADLIGDGTHKKCAEARDLLLSVLDDHPSIFDHPTESNLRLIRSTAQRCSQVGPFSRAIDLFRKLAQGSNLADDYFQLSEILTQGNFFEESVASLEKAIALDPATYDTAANRETLDLAKSRVNQPAAPAANSRRKIGRYPETEVFRGDFRKLVTDHIAVNLKGEPKFVDRSTRFFTMGSCFARNLAANLSGSGYSAHHMEISEYINTTFANRVFVDYLSDVEIDPATRERIVELLPPGWSKDNTLQIIKNSGVFILTLGVAPAFFDRATGKFVLPRPSGLNSRALAENYQFRTTSVQENVDNVLYLIAFIRKLSPDIRIVVTVSPVPLLASFEFESAVQADCLSKSTMRLVAHEVVNASNIQNIMYWPAFEIFRWAGSNAGNYYAADDGAAWHVSEEKVSGTIAAFVDMFSAA